jgi:quinolinate synthase
MNVWQQPLPQHYRGLSEPELRLRVERSKQALGHRLVILGHHYQQDAVIEFADFTGDSFELSRIAAEQKGIEFVIFCGVHFMAESADILTDESVKVMLPDLGAGCSMADMANLDQTIECWEQLAEACPDQQVVPITYMNSSAAIKAFVGEHGGAVCTSSNCRSILEWALAGGEAAAKAQGSALGSPAAHKVKILFFPDQHLGRNTATSMGYPPDRMVVWDPKQELGGNERQKLIDADFVLWKGHCSVHQLFRPEHVDQARAKFPGIKVIVHPECRQEVVQKADLVGSTSFIVKQLEAAPPGSQWAVGTEVHLITRLARAHPEQKIIVLSDCQCLCTTMYRIDLPHLCWTLENLVEGKVINQIKVDPQTRKWATLALERMLAITARQSPGAAKEPRAAAISLD